MTILSFFTNTLKFCLGAVGLAVGALYYFQDNLLYYPAMGDLPLRTSENPRGYRSPAEHGIEFEDVMIGTTTPNVKIHAWLLLRSDHSRSRPPTLIFFHGNAGNIGFRLPNARYMVESLGCNVLMVEVSDMSLARLPPLSFLLLSFSRLPYLLTLNLTSTTPPKSTVGMETATKLW